MSLSNDGYCVLGDPSGQNLAMDINEVMARDAGAAATLHLNADGGNVIIGSNTAGSLGIGTNSRDFYVREVKETDAAGWSDFITYDGIGLGSETGTNRQMLLLTDGTGGDQVMVLTTSADHGVTWTPVLSVEQEGQVGINTVNSSVELDVNGDIECISLTETSDIRYKESIENINGALETISQFRGVTYHWRQDEFPEMKFDDQEHLGFIAQEISEVLPNVVVTDEEGYMSVDYSRITPVLVEAVKELKTENEELKAQVSKLTSLVEKILLQGNSITGIE